MVHVHLPKLRDDEYLFTSESVSEGHPDKICDQVSDAILDEFLKTEPESRVAVETLATTNKIVIAGETRGPKEINAEFMEQIARNVVKEIGYEQEGFNWKNLDVDVLVHDQSVDIAQGVDSGEEKEEGAGDQGLMFGYACDETEELMPAPIFYAHKILRKLAEDRHSGILSKLGPDAKSQVSLQYDNGKVVKAHSVLVSTQHDEGLSQDDIREMVQPYVESILPEGWMCDDDRFLVNPTGKFVIGGPDGDCGLTGRKIIVDTYGGAAPHGGGAFSGKDPTKVDRSAAYMARYLAKNIVSAGLASQCDIQIAYAIGVSQPVSFYINTFGKGRVDNRKIEKFILDNIDLSPKGIRNHLNLNRPIYKQTAAYGHFGRSPEKEGGFPWEETNLVDELKTL